MGAPERREREGERESKAEELSAEVGGREVATSVPTHPLFTASVDED